MFVSMESIVNYKILHGFEWLYELKRLYPEAQYCDYFLESKIGPTASQPGNSNVRTIYGYISGQKL